MYFKKSLLSKYPTADQRAYDHCDVCSYILVHEEGCITPMGYYSRIINITSGKLQVNKFG